jgi:outer membrane lipoprotein SlyB
MKKIIIILIATIGFIGLGYSQTDDGYVTRYLNINTSESKIVSYLSGFDEGFAKVKSGELKTQGEVENFYAIKISEYPSIENAATQNNSRSGLSTDFLQKLNGVVSKTGTDYVTVEDIRNAFVRITRNTQLSTTEAEVLALMDLSFQKMIQKYPVDIFSSAYMNKNYAMNAGYPYGTTLNSLNAYKLPSWARCALGTIGSAILGGIGGAAGGAQVGAHIGAAIGGVLGVIGGAFTGVASYC